MSDCPIIVNDGVANMVDLAYDKYSAFASKAYQLALDQLGNQAAFKLPTLNSDVVFNIDDSVYGFNRPLRPTLPGIVYNDPGAVPAVPDLPTPVVTFDSAPTPPADTPPDIIEYAQPGAFDVPDPAAAPAIAPVTIPDAPVLTLPDLPTLDALSLPEPPVLTLPTFDAVQPINTLSAPAQTWSFTPEQYKSALLDKTSGQISTMLDGGTGLPAAVAQALRDRANAAVDAEEQRQVEQAYEEYGARGFEEPPGALKKRVAAARQSGQNQRAAINRDIYIQEQQVAIENLRFAVTQGVALEGALMQNFTEFMRMGLDAARAAMETTIALFNAEVSLFNAEQQAYATAAQVYRDRVQAQLATLDLYRAQIEGERARGEINLQRVQIYSEQVRALGMQVEIYRAEVEGRKAQADVNRAMTESYRATIEGYAERVRAYAVQWDGFRAQQESNATKARVYDLTTQAFATRVAAWDRTQQGKIAQAGLTISQNDMHLRGWRGQLDAILAKYTAERDRIAALVSIAGNQVDLYRADAAVETAAADANLRMLTAGIAREQARTQVELKNAELAINQLIEDSRIIVSVNDSIARTAAQLAASSMSAVNFSAGISSSLGQSYGCHTSFNYSGAIDTTTP